ncbi:hypothetical protein E2C01_065954 [Portunus trituberculatus]|uniref:Uncharacterized protein n=1 Tax=Portunus trituberculatus TaxID=210409 RepID=A0A5B7HPP9_PORTR|nr:hypothetical protein [Portunus trituberculatus]
MYCTTVMQSVYSNSPTMQLLPGSLRLAILSRDCTLAWPSLCCKKVKESEDVSHRFQVEKRDLFLQERIVGQGKVPGILQVGHSSQHQHRPHPTLISKHDVGC